MQRSSRAVRAKLYGGVQNDGGKSIAALQQKLAGKKSPAGPGLALGIAKDSLVAIGLDGTGRWTRSGAVDSRPALAGDVLVLSGGDAVIGLDAKSGQELWSVSSEGRRLRGAGDDGTITVVSLGSSERDPSLFLAIDRTGSVKQKIEFQPQIGRPAVLAGVAFIPWGDQYVSALDLASGDEVARLLLREKVSNALSIGGELWFGEKALFRFDQQIGLATSQQATRVALAPRELPGKPVWFDDGRALTPATASARDRIRLYARPIDNRKLDSDRYAATYFRIAFGLSASDGALRWTRAYPADIVAGSAVEAGYVFCDAKGGVHKLIGSNGADAGSVSLGSPLRACVVQAGDHKLGSGRDPGPLAQQIGQALEAREAEMAAAHELLLRELAREKEPIATKILIDLASNGLTPPSLLEQARTLLSERRNGSQYMLEALERHYDFLSDVLRPPPVGPLADALAAIGEKRAAAPLARHLNDPANATDDIERAARALAKLASASELDELKTFFALYRATAEEKPLIEAVLAVAQALLRVGGEEARSIIKRAVADPLTNQEVKRGLTALDASPAPSASTAESG